MRTVPPNAAKEATEARGVRPGPAGPGSPRATGGEQIDEAFLRPAGFIGLLGIAMIHFVDLFRTWKERPLIGVAFLALIIACVLAAGWWSTPGEGGKPPASWALLRWRATS